MGNRAYHEPGGGWRTVFEPGLWRQGLVAGTAGAVSMAILACAVALARDTTGHDWYAAAKITVADLTIGVGFDEDAPVEYRNANGEVDVAQFGLHGVAAHAEDAEARGVGTGLLAQHGGHVSTGC